MGTIIPQDFLFQFLITIWEKPKRATIGLKNCNHGILSRSFRRINNGFLLKKNSLWNLATLLPKYNRTIFYALSGMLRASCMLKAMSCLVWCKPCSTNLSWLNHKHTLLPIKPMKLELRLNSILWKKKITLKKQTDVKAEQKSFCNKQQKLINTLGLAYAKVCMKEFYSRLNGWHLCFKGWNSRQGETPVIVNQSTRY